MNDNISWDSSLVKKFSCSNHFKLLNQLRSEVKKYPLNNKKKLLPKLSQDNIIDSKASSNRIISQEIPLSKNSKNTNDDINNKNSVSFNNSKNFSVYNNVRNDSFNEIQNNMNLPDKKSVVETYNTSFKDRLNEIDMK